MITLAEITTKADLLAMIKEIERQLAALTGRPRQVEPQ